MLNKAECHSGELWKNTQYHLSITSALIEQQISPCQYSITIRVDDNGKTITVLNYTKKGQDYYGL